MEAPPSRRKGRRSGGATERLNPHVDLYLWRPCVGIYGVCSPLASWSDMIDGTYTLEDVKDMHSVMDELVYQRDRIDGRG